MAADVALDDVADSLRRISVDSDRRGTRYFNSRRYTHNLYYVNYCGNRFSCDNLSHPLPPLKCLGCTKQIRETVMNQKSQTQNQPEMASLLLGAGFALASLIILPAVAQRVGLGSSVTIALRGALMRAANRF